MVQKQIAEPDIGELNQIQLRILIAEDEHSIAAQYKLILEKRGHRVRIAEDGEQCVKVYSEAMKESNDHNNSPFDVVVLDYRMPGMDGMEVAEHILRINPKQRIVFASAYVKESLMEAVQRLKRIVEFMQKPFRLVSLVGAIEDRKICEELERLNAIISQVKDFNPAPEQIRELLDGLNRIQRGRDYLIDGIKKIEDTIKISCLTEQGNAT